MDIREHIYCMYSEKKVRQKYSILYEYLPKQINENCKHAYKILFLSFSIDYMRLMKGKVSLISSSSIKPFLIHIFYKYTEKHIQIYTLQHICQEQLHKKI